MAEPSLFTPLEPPPRVAALSELAEGQQADCFVLLVDRHQATTRDGKPYWRVTFRDRRREITQPIWSDSGWFEAARDWQPGTFYKVRGVYRESDRYGGQLEIERIRPVRPGDEPDGFDPNDFFDRSRFDVTEMFGELCDLVRREVSDLALRQLVLAILQEHEAAIKQIPSATHNHHAFAGGFLEHTLSVSRTCVYLADKYAEYYRHVQPPLDKSLIVAGGVLHDIGKVRELAYRPEGTAEYTAEGRLIGHILIGRDLVREAATHLPEPLDPETLLRLEHVIVAHQNLAEWGSPKAPHTPESLIVHYADDLDAKLQMMMVALEQASGPGPFTSRDNALRRHIYRGPAS